jgi:hypothetical protein
MRPGRQGSGSRALEPIGTESLDGGQVRLALGQQPLPERLEGLARDLDLTAVDRLLELAFGLAGVEPAGVAAARA